ncbi:MAG: hypothetical protein ACP5NW_02840, partial [Candidatus Woesearchaeota archaeon]
KNNQPIDTKSQNDKYEKDTAAEIGFKVTGFKEKILDTLQKYGIYDAYSNYTKKDLSRLESEYRKLDWQISQHQSELEGRVKYIPMKNGTDEEFRQKRSIPESSKGLEYKMNEQEDLARIAYKKFQMCEIKRDQYATNIIKIETDISMEKTKPVSEASIQRINALTTERYEMNKQKVTYEKLMNDFAKQLTSKRDVFKAYQQSVMEKELFLDESKTALTTIGTTIEVMRAYIASPNSTKITLDETLNLAAKLMERVEQYKGAAAVRQEKNRTRMDRIRGMNSYSGDGIVNNDYYNAIAQVLNQNRTAYIGNADKIAHEMGF